MADPRLHNLARILVHYSTAIQARQWVLLRTSLAAYPLAQAVAAEITAAGAHYSLLWDDEALDAQVLQHGDEAQAAWLNPLQLHGLTHADALIALRAPQNTRALSHVPPAKMQAYHQARRPALETYFKRTAEGQFKWVVTQFPCPAFAQDADMSLAEYENFVYAATFADLEDPVAEWRKMQAEQARYIDYLADKQALHVQGEHIDLRLSIAGRKFINCSGQANVPDGEIFTGPVEDSVQGWVRFSYPAIKDGAEVEGIELGFEAGKVVKATARKNEGLLLSLLDSDPGARVLGEFAIATNHRIQTFSKQILYDEKIGGTVHMAVGAGYPESGSLNKSSIHWDMICDMRSGGRITADGEVFYENGRFLI
jgi:aminopeptidase